MNRLFRWFGFRRDWFADDDGFVRFANDTWRVEVYLAWPLIVRRLPIMKRLP